MATLVVNPSNFGKISSNNVVYATARVGSNLSAESTVSIGQHTTYYVWEGFLDFDTSSLGSTAIVSEAILAIRPSNNSSDTDFTLTAALSAWGASLTTTDWVAGADLAALTTLATLTTVGISTTTYNDFVDVAMPANISLTGNTRMLIYSSRHSGNNTPTTQEYIDLYSSFPGRNPRLTITYSIQSQTHQGML